MVLIRLFMTTSEYVSQVSYNYSLDFRVIWMLWILKCYNFICLLFFVWFLVVLGLMPFDWCNFSVFQELEPFPEIDIFDEIREFHQELCRAYSPKDHFLKVDCLQHLNNLHHCQNMAFSPNQFLFFMERSLSVCEEIFLPSTKITFVEVLPFAFLLFQFIVSSM